MLFKHCPLGGKKKKGVEGKRSDNWLRHFAEWNNIRQKTEGRSLCHMCLSLVKKKFADFSFLEKANSLCIVTLSVVTSLLFSYCWSMYSRMLSSSASSRINSIIIMVMPLISSSLPLIPGSGRITLNIREIEERRRIRLEDMGEGQSAEVWTEQELW